MGDELVSRIPYQCNNRSTGFYIKPIHSLQWSCLHSSPYPLPIGVMRCDAALHTSWWRNWSPKSRGMGGLRTPRL